MSGKNINLLSFGVGVKRNDTDYAIGAHWWDANLVRWHNNTMEPVGGWENMKTVDGETIPDGTKSIRDVFSWRDYLKSPYVAFGAADSVHIAKIGPNTSDYIWLNVTPSDLAWDPEGTSGFGSGFFGAGFYGYTPASPVNPDSEGQWSFDNWGRKLAGVHSQDGRLFEWDPQVGGEMTPVPNAPVDNTICIVSEEEFLFVMGGKNNPNRVQWCSRRDNTDWEPTETNSAGGFDLQTDGSIISAKRTQGGILVITNTDIHMIEYVGPPNYYGRRLISTYSGGISKNAIVSIPGGVVWADSDGFWKFDGNISRFPCDVHHHVFDNIRLDLPSRLFMGINEGFSEFWFFYPTMPEKEPRNYCVFSYGTTPNWTIGKLDRTAWHAPVYALTPIAVEDRRPYYQETGWLAAGQSRAGQVFVQSGPIELSDGDKTMRVDRFYHDSSNRPAGPEVILDPYTVTFKLRQAPSALERVKGPYNLNTEKGYTTVRMRARQIAMRIDQTDDAYWTLGKPRIRVKPAGNR